MKKTCAVIGAGIAGIAAAIRVAARGYAVSIYDANSYAGGKFKEQHAAGYRFDMGPSVLMMPHLIDELFVLCGKNPRDYFSYSPIELAFKYFFEDGVVLNAYADTELFGREIALKTTDTAAAFEAYRKDIEAKYNITNEVFIENSLHKIGNFLTPKMVSGLWNFPKIDAFKTMDEGNRKYFKDPRLVQVFNNYATYVGSNPYVAPATLNVIQHLEINLGAYLPAKGMYAIIEAMVQLAKEMGVQFFLNTRVDEITIAGNTVKGIAVNGESIAYDRVISNADIYFTYKNLLKGVKSPDKILNQPKSSSVIAFYWGVKTVHESLGVHNMLFSANDRGEYDAVFEQKNISDDPSVYIFITSKMVPADAPPGCENWFCLITAPHDAGQDWHEMVARTRKNVISKIDRLLHTSIEKHIVYEDLLTPPLIRDNYSSAFGAVYGNNSNNKFASFFRHPNFSRRIQGLYFVGGSVHPGPGIPMCLNSARILDKVFR